MVVLIDLGCKKILTSIEYSKKIYKVVTFCWHLVIYFFLKKKLKFCSSEYCGMHINSAAFVGKVDELIVMDQLCTILGKANFQSGSGPRFWMELILVALLDDLIESWIEIMIPSSLTVLVSGFWHINWYWTVFRVWE